MENLDLKEFNNACLDLLTGKYLLAENKISHLLRTISTNQKLTNLVSHCLENFDFNNTFSACAGQNQIINLPEDSKSIVAFCFSLLYHIDSKAIKFYDFLNQFYNYNEITGAEGFKTFARNIILPFKEAVNNMYAKTHVLVDNYEYQSNIYNKINKVCQLAKGQLESFKLKQINMEELVSILKAMEIACERNDRDSVYAMLVALDYFSLKHKKVTVLYNQFQECFS